MKQDFKAGKGARLSEEQAKKYGSRISELCRERNEMITPEDVLKDAEKTSSPLHDYFQWNDEAAAYSYRLNQARYLLRSINIEVMLEASEEPKTVRAFYNVINSDEESVYAPLVTVFKSVDLRAQVIKQALNEAQEWQDKYETYQELSEVCDAIKRTKQKLFA